MKWKLESYDSKEIFKINNSIESLNEILKYVNDEEDLIEYLDLYNEIEDSFFLFINEKLQVS